MCETILSVKKLLLVYFIYLIFFLVKFLIFEALNFLFLQFC